jgi:hypothetical protein
MQPIHPLLIDCIGLFPKWCLKDCILDRAKNLAFKNKKLSIKNQDVSFWDD